MKNCGICRRRLDQVMDPLSKDCGGDCLGCMIHEENTESGAYTQLEVDLRDRVCTLELMLAAAKGNK